MDERDRLVVGQARQRWRRRRCGCCPPAGTEVFATDAQATVAGGDASDAAATGSGSSAASDLSKPTPEGDQGAGVEAASNAAETSANNPSYRDYQRGSKFRRWQGAGRIRGGRTSFKSDRIKGTPAYENPFLKRNDEEGEGEDGK
eukprot:TRINITY_DN390_c0_g1_i1.p2 TRINITY_DN390_c0_g1~~TRINITY_DN390_c0_g1_i1.p2  ORF type:complete len:145 (+),score=22.49 TRINITY_DN390_c0_g1_i1:767-1201(+)